MLRTKITKRVCVTPAGRRKYLEILVRYMNREYLAGNFDEWRLWINTTAKSDINYIHSLAAKYEFITAVEPKMPFAGNISIAPFFVDCCEPNTVYLRLDDDIVFIEENAIREIFKFRLEHRKYFLIFGNIVNNSICSGIRQIYHAMPGFPKTISVTDCFDETGWGNPIFAEFLHETFLDTFKAYKNHYYWHFVDGLSIAISNPARFSINVMSWLGSEFAKFAGKLPIPCDEEEYLSETLPKHLKKMNCIYGEAIFVHFAFYPQREYLENNTNLLQKYYELSKNI
jgi:hypothetical protein